MYSKTVDRLDIITINDANYSDPGVDCFVFVVVVFWLSSHLHQCLFGSEGSVVAKL